jgi:general secretion pathway protein L
VNSRAVFVPTLVLAALLLLAGSALLAHSALQDKRYLGTLEAEIAKLEPQAKRAAALDRQIDRTQSRVRLLDEFRGHSKADLDALNELTRILAPPTWSNAIDITRDAVTISGETEQAAPLLKIIDASLLFQNSEFAGSLGRAANNEQFRIRATREGQR